MGQQTVIPVVGASEFTLDNFFRDGNKVLVKELVDFVNGKRTNPVLYFWGAPGSGKTHLLNACCELAAEIGRPFRYLSLGDQGVANSTNFNFVPKTLLCLDNIHRLGLQNDNEIEMLSLYEQVVANGGNMIAAARNPLDKIGIAMADLTSRLVAGGTFHLELLDDNNRRCALQQRAQLRGFELNDQVLDYIMNRFDRDTASLFALLDTLDRASLVRQRKITIPFIRDITS